MRALNRFIVLAIAAWGLYAPSGAEAQSYPSRPIRFIVPYPPGGSTDTYSRIIGAKLGEALGQPLVMDNRAGAAGSVGAELAAKAPPDGYTIVLGQDSNMVVGQAVRATKNYDTLRDFAPISLVVRTPQVIVVNDTSPFKSLKDLIAAAKAKPGALTYASAGVAGSSHVLGIVLQHAAGIDTLHVPYKGGGPGMLDLRAGRVSYMVTSMVSSMNFVRDGRARLLAVTGAKRSHLFPDVPTVARVRFSGIRDDPVARRDGAREGSAGGRRARQPGGRQGPRHARRAETAAAEGGIVSPSTPEEFAAFLRADVDRWTKMIKQTGITLD